MEIITYLLFCDVRASSDLDIEVAGWLSLIILVNSKLRNLESSSSSGVLGALGFRTGRLIVIVLVLVLDGLGRPSISRGGSIGIRFFRSQKRFIPAIKKSRTRTSSRTIIIAGASRAFSQLPAD